MTFGFGTVWSREFCQCGLALCLGNKTKLGLRKFVAGGEVPWQCGVPTTSTVVVAGGEMTWVIGSCGLLADLVVVPGDRAAIWSACFLAKQLVRFFIVVDSFFVRHCDLC